MNPMQQMLQQAQRMQRELEKAHTELEAKEFVGEKNGMVTVTMTGDKKVKEIKIEPEALEPDNAEILQDAIMVAINDTMGKIIAEEEALSEKVTGRKGGFPF